MSESVLQSESQANVPLSILALDDDQDFCEYIHAILSPCGHTVRTVSTPEALFKEAGGHLPDVILLDMNMGLDSGGQVLRKIREKWPKQCVIVITGYPSLDSMRETFKQDVFDYIAKPFSVEDLCKSLGQAAMTLGLGQRPMDRLRSVLGRQIRLARTEHGWTLRELSEVSLVSVSQLSSIERGTHLPSVESLVAISGALKAAPSTWFGAAGF